MPIDPNNLERYPLFNLFWNTHGDPDLSGGGLNEVTPRGAEKLFEYAKKHELDGAASADGMDVVNEEEKAFIKALLEHPRYSSFFELDGKVHLMELFGLRTEDVHTPDAVLPKDQGELHLPDRVSTVPANRLANVEPRQLPSLMQQEYAQNRRLFEGSDLSPEQRGLNTLGLLRDYAQALWTRGEIATTEQIGHELLDVFQKFRNAPNFGAKNFNGAAWSAAQGLVLGQDPNHFATSFPEARSDVPQTYLSMSKDMAAPMTFVDKYLKAKGLPTGAEKHELASPLNWMIGEVEGHYKRGNLNESRPFTTSGVNFGIVLFPGDAEIKAAKVKPGFEFAIDCLDGFNNFLTCNPAAGERMIATDKNGVRLAAEKVIEDDGQGGKLWSAKFKRPDGTEVPATEVVGRFQDANGNLKGDGKASGEVNMWWWGFCDRNTAQKLYKAKFKIPELDVDVIKLKAGSEIIEFPRADAQKLIDADIPDIVTGDTFCGFRFNDEPQQVVLKDGRTLVGRVSEEVLQKAPSRMRIQEDIIAIRNDEKKPMLGSLDVKIDGNVETIAVADVVSIEKDPTTGKVVIDLDNTYRDTVTGELMTEVPWDRAENREGKLFLAQGEDKPIRGEVKVELSSGGTEKIPVSKINYIAGEMQNDLRFSQWMSWVSKQGGMYASDSALNDVVSNGMRWVNQIDQEVHAVDHRPAWAPTGELMGIQGPFEAAPEGGDHVVWARGKYAYREGEPVNSTAWSGWVHVNKSGRILNEGFIEGQSDFGWGANGPLNWQAKSTFNPFMDPDLRVRLLINGTKDLKSDTPNTEDMAKRLSLPVGWKSLRTEG